MFWKLFAVFFIVFLVFRRWKLRKLTKTYKGLKSDWISLPFLGHTLHFIGDTERQMSGWCRFGREAISKGGLSSFWIVDYLIITVADAELAEYVMKTCMEKGQATKVMRFVTGNGSVFAPGDFNFGDNVSWNTSDLDDIFPYNYSVSIWRPRRKILAPTFSQKNLNQFVNVFAKQSCIMVEKLAKHDGEPFSIWKYLTTYTMDSVCETILGVQLKVQDDPDHPFLKAFEECMQLVATRLISPWQHSTALYKLLPSGKKLTQIKQRLVGFINEVIERKRQENRMPKQEVLDHDKTTGKKETALETFLDLLIKASGGERGYSNLELQEELFVLVMAGNDTSAVGSAFTALMLARHQDVQDKVYQEIKDLYGDSRRPVVPEDLPKLKYLDMVFRETLRLYPPVPMTVRRADTDVTLPNGAVIGAGSEFLIHLWALHRNPRYWGSDAEEFRPERFLEPLHHPAQFMAFSYGPRNCIGYQNAMISSKTVLTTLLREYRLLPDKQETYPYKPLRIKFNIMLKHVEDFVLRIERRQ